MIKNISTDRLLLAELTVMDEEQVFELHNNSEVLKYYTEKPVPAKADTILFIKRITAPGNFVWSIRLQSEKNKIIGDCALHDFDKENNSIEIGGTLLPEYWGKGIMAEAFKSIIDFALTELKVTSLVGRTLTCNKQAIRLGEKLGFYKISEDKSDTVLLLDLHTSFYKDSSL